MHFLRERTRAARISILILVFFLLPIFCFAQKNELSFTVGGLISSDQTVGFNVCPAIVPSTCVGAFSAKTNTGVGFEGVFSRQLFHFGPGSLDLELPLLGAPSRDIHLGEAPGGPGASALFFTPSVRLQFFHSKPISPFASIGGGLAHFGFQGNDRTTGALQYGGGLDFKTPLPHLAFRAEVRDFYAAGPIAPTSVAPVSPARQHNVFAGGGIVLRF